VRLGLNALIDKFTFLRISANVTDMARWALRGIDFTFPCQFWTSSGLVMLGLKGLF
jgi:hypothetical protein